MSLFERMYKNFKDVNSDESSQMSTSVDENHDTSVNECNYDEESEDLCSEVENVNIDNILNEIVDSHLSVGGEESNEMSQMSHAHANINRGFNSFLGKDNIPSQILPARARDNWDDNDSDYSSFAGNCEKCPASGEWQWKGSGLWCFHSSWFLGKSAKSAKCEIEKRQCPLTKSEEDCDRPGPS
jgi:hypothetical protein